MRPSTVTPNSGSDKGGKRGAASAAPEVQPVLAARQIRQLRYQRLEGGGHGQRDHGVEDGAHAQACQPDQQREGQRHRQAAGGAGQHRGPARFQPHAGDGHAIGADAEEHGVRADDAGIAQQQVVAGHQHDEHQDLGRDRERLRSGEQERRGKQQQRHRDQQRAQHHAARRIAGKQT